MRDGWPELLTVEKAWADVYLCPWAACVEGALDVVFKEEHSSGYVYCLIYMGNIVYIGRSSQHNGGNKRISQHDSHYRFTQYMVSHVKCPCAAECYLIWLYRPYYNVDIPDILATQKNAAAKRVGYPIIPYHHLRHTADDGLDTELNTTNFLLRTHRGSKV